MHPFLKVEVTEVTMQSGYIWRVTWRVVTETSGWGERGFSCVRASRNDEQRIMRKLPFLPFLNPLQTGKFGIHLQEHNNL
jgi:hypothetical protein